ncbi:TIGR02217 family protein [Silicimonas sp. MF1-12-2]|uniref:phage distal tail protein, Rcc01695 family n=1 Tax=Silicimonas sp. MF1-12-2 TaxID=3384793 RepID=UPI0039B3A6FD
MTFHEVRFPANLSFGSIGGPERLTEIVTLANGFEERNTPWADSRRRYDAGLGMRSLSDIDALIAFFEARRGRLHGFRWKDWSDYRSSGSLEEPGFEDQILSIGDGSRTAFQLRKIYRSGDVSYSRDIRKPVQGTVRVGLQGDFQTESVDFTVDPATGIVTFADAPPQGATVTAGFEFDVPVRFDTDSIQTSVASFKAGDIPNVPVVEVRI